MGALEVALLPALMERPLAGRVAVVIDVLRATTTATWALAQGVMEILPRGTLDDARRAAGQLPGSLLGGERGGVLIPGFDLGNSPAEYTAERVGGRRVIFTTTNGTAAMLACRDAADVLLASFVNLNAVVAHLAKSDAVTILCAGTDGAVTSEDCLLAGAIVAACRRRKQWQLNDQARLAAHAWSDVERRPLVEALAQSQGGRNLTALGKAEDIRFASQWDLTTCVGRFDPAAMAVTAAVEAA